MMSLWFAFGLAGSDLYNHRLRTQKRSAKFVADTVLVHWRESSQWCDKIPRARDLRGTPSWAVARIEADSVLAVGNEVSGRGVGLRQSTAPFRCDMLSRNFKSGFRTRTEATEALARIRVGLGG
jgi:hypothetical protein